MADQRPDPDPSKVEAVSFDLDGTLVDAAAGWRIGFQQAFARLVEHHPELADLGEALTVHDREFVAYMNEAHLAGGGREWDSAFVRQAFRELLARHASRNDALADEVFEEYEVTWPRSVDIYEETPAVLDALHGRVRLVMISNGLTQYQRPKIDRYDLGRYFDRLVISEEVGVVKPELAIFEAALEGLDVAPAATIHVGDSLDHDVVGARRAGWLAAWVRRGDGHASADDDPTLPLDERPHLEVTSLDEVVTWLDGGG